MVNVVIGILVGILIGVILGFVIFARILNDGLKSIGAELGVSIECADENIITDKVLEGEQRE